MLFHCLCDSDWIIIWIAFNWQDFKMFCFCVHSLIQFWTFQGNLFFPVKPKGTFLRKKKQFGCRLHHCTLVHYTFNPSTADTIGLQSEMIIWSHYRRKLKTRNNTRGSEGRATSRNAAACVFKISHCQVVIPPARSEAARCVRLEAVSQRLPSAPSLDVTLISL